MKKILTLVLLLVTLVTTAFADLYPTTFVVVNVDHISDELTLKDACGNLWIVNGVEDYFVGDGVSAIMFDNDTERVEDDIIVDMTYTCLEMLKD